MELGAWPPICSCRPPSHHRGQHTAVLEVLQTLLTCSSVPLALPCPPSLRRPCAQQRPISWGFPAFCTKLCVCPFLWAHRHRYGRIVTLSWCPAAYLLGHLCPPKPHPSFEPLGREEPRVRPPVSSPAVNPGCTLQPPGTHHCLGTVHRDSVSPDEAGLG